MKYRIRDKVTGKVVINNGYLTMTPEGKIFNHATKEEDPYMVAEMFTGIQDINGKDMYEGDIVHVESKDRIWSIEFGYFGDHMFYVRDNINSGRVLEWEGVVYGDFPYFTRDGKDTILCEVVEEREDD